MPREKIISPTDYAEKPATTLQNRFADWIISEVGYDPNNAKSKADAFRAGVRIATATRMVFQASDYNRQANAAARAARESAVTEPKPKAAKPTPAAPAKAAKPKTTTSATKATPAKAAKPKLTPAAKAAAATRAAKTTTATAPVEPAAPKKTTTRRQRPAASAPATADEAPF